jgi:Cu(I)/Ag(I) efflux system membrane fusion protein
MNMRALTTAVAAFAIGIGVAAIVFVTMDNDEPSPNSGDSQEAQVLYWVAPMDPNFRRPGPGKSPMGMNLIPVYEGSQSPANSDGSNSVIISSAMVQNLGVRTARAERRDLERSIRTVGYVAADDNMISHVHVRAEGWVERLIAKAVGDPVHKDQPLFELYAPDIHVALGEFSQFLQRGEMDMLEITLGRLNLLDVPEREIQALRDGGPVKRRSSILSPLDGVVLSLNIGEGMFVKPEMTTMVVADLSSVWVLADVFEDQASWLKPGLAATLNLTYQPEVTRSGTVDYVYPTVDAQTRTLTARLRFDNPDGVLKLNMFAEVQIHTKPAQNVIVVPREALIRTGLSERVVVALGGGRFRSVEVRSGQESESFVEILEGLGPDDEVVVSGQFLIDSESNLSGAIQRMGIDSESDAVSRPAP